MEAPHARLSGALPEAVVPPGTAASVVDGNQVPAGDDQPSVHRTRSLPLLLALLVALLVSALAWVADTGTAQAHTALSSSSPAEGATVTDALSVVTLTFGGGVRSPAITVTGPDGAVVSTGPAIDEGDSASVPVAPTASGQHTVAWSVTSADGHELTGTVVFDYAGPLPAAVPTATAPSEATVTATSPSPEPADPSPAASTRDDSGPNLLVTSVAALLAVGAVGAVVLLVRRLRR